MPTHRTRVASLNDGYEIILEHDNGDRFLVEHARGRTVRTLLGAIARRAADIIRASRTPKYYRHPLFDLAQGVRLGPWRVFYSGRTLVDRVRDGEYEEISKYGVFDTM